MSVKKRLLFGQDLPFPHPVLGTLCLVNVQCTVYSYRSILCVHGFPGLGNPVFFDGRKLSHRFFLISKMKIQIFVTPGKTLNSCLVASFKNFLQYFTPVQCIVLYCINQCNFVIQWWCLLLSHFKRCLILPFN